MEGQGASVLRQPEAKSPRFRPPSLARPHLLYASLLFVPGVICAHLLSSGFPRFPDTPSPLPSTPRRGPEGRVEVRMAPRGRDHSPWNV